ncbi:DUF4038 domain-containing protein [Streptomyces hoynatensis]|uniref:DUF4038 domain-containing protein n=1 Tax=Streptomyces hoynatensis TaxID=1141874 RepID=A0A3A9YWW2_9ACTN|nr:DUF4038 domain-containing protein [Streptomyces hoynatensis]RKN39737.1 DUF4038 domain-containing protein [Streptomyces hoynatensis]
MPVEQWDLYEAALDGPAHGNPFREVHLTARFRHEAGAGQSAAAVETTGCYDGEGRYLLRFMPHLPGTWRWETRSNDPGLDARRGSFTCEPASGDNHGPVRVRDTHHFAYADGTPYWQLGTTCYAWTHQGDALAAQTLATLAGAPFNKLRMCVFPKHYAYNRNDPERYPFAGSRQAGFDLDRFDPAFFRDLERRVAALRDLGIEADLILFHPYDRGHWGFDAMGAEADEHYLRYVVARLAPYRNVWWSLANEYDLLAAKSRADWERLGRLLRDLDPYGHLRSIHNCHAFYDHNRPWITHASVQSGRAVAGWGGAAVLREAYGKPVVFDEVRYEGDIDQPWGRITARELVHRFWQGTVAGTYVGHGETYRHPEDLLWWSKGGVLRGESPPRLAFLREVLEALPAGLEQIGHDDRTPDTAYAPGGHYLVYLGDRAPDSWPFRLPVNPGRHEVAEGARFRVEVLDTWHMRITEIPGPFTATLRTGRLAVDRAGRAVPLPAEPWQALRITPLPG